MHSERLRSFDYTVLNLVLILSTGPDILGLESVFCFCFVFFCFENNSLSLCWVGGEQAPRDEEEEGEYRDLLFQTTSNKPSLLYSPSYTASYECALCNWFLCFWGFYDISNLVSSQLFTLSTWDSIFFFPNVLC